LSPVTADTRHWRRRLGGATIASSRRRGVQEADMTREMTFDTARDEVSTGSAGGSPFLMAFGLSLFLTGIASFYLSDKAAALVLLFQGNLALPLAFWLEKRMGSGGMSPDNPLKTLSVQLAMTQIVALPAVLIAYALAPWATAGAFAAIGGGHFLPYAWLQRSRTYLWLGIAVSVGSYALTMTLEQASFPWVLFYVAACYWVCAPLVYRRAQALGHQRLAVAF
jgi:hypothetical protein